MVCQLVYELYAGVDLVKFERIGTYVHGHHDCGFVGYARAENRLGVVVVKCS